MTITINRPEARNAVNRDVCLGVGNALTQADENPGIRAIVLTGAGGKSFCAGADLKAIARGEDIVPAGREEWGFAGWVGHPVATPTICAVNGTALGGGTELALASDLVVAADSALFGLPEVKRGLMAAAGGAFRLADRIPRAVAMELLLTGEAISADRALQLGLINRVDPASDVLSEAQALAEQIAANAPLAVQATKRVAAGIVNARIVAEDRMWECNAREAGSRALKRGRDRAGDRFR